LSKDELLRQVEGHLKQGYTAFKLKIGRADHEEDLDRCRAVRALIGRNCELLLDVNQKWKPAEAVQRLRSLAEVSPGFIEEPLLSDDVPGHVHVRAHGGVPVAVGEQLGNKYEFWNYVRAGAADYLQPCPWKVGGITEWMKIAAMAQCANLVLSSHAALELSQHLAAAIPHGSKIENIFGVSLFDLGASLTPVEVKDGAIALPDTPGHGIVFDGPALDRHEVRDGSHVARKATTHGGM
jgi:L-alanine-DL-glutamate epimerase-like enolase superfamily enzyme